MKTRSLPILAAACVAGQLSAQTLVDYQATVTGQAPAHYFKLDNSLGSEVSAVALIDQGTTGGFTYDLFGNPTNSYFFIDSASELSNETDPLINTSGTTSGPIDKKGSITFLFRSLAGFNDTGERWLFDGRKLLSGGGTGSSNALALFFERDDLSRTNPGSLKLEFGDTTQTILEKNDIVFSSWYYFALTYDESRVPNKAIWYLGRAGGALSSGVTTNDALAVAGEDSGLFVGNRSTTGGGFRSPGNGRIDEFAIWHTELTPAQISNQFANVPALSGGGVLVTNVVVDDSFADDDRANTGPLQAAWWSSTQASGLSVEVTNNQLGLVSGGSGRGLHGTFAPQTLGVGDTIRATYTFMTPATVGVNRSTALKVALMELSDPGLAADLESSSTIAQPLYFDFPGYMGDFDVNTGATADTNIREHNTNTTGRFTSTTTEWTALGGSGDIGYGFAANTEYVGVYSITRSDFGTVDISCSISQGGTLMDSHTESDSANIVTNYGVLGFAVGSSTFGSSNLQGVDDNGMDFSNIKVEVITTAPVAPPSLSITPASGNVIVSWPVEGSSGFNLQSATSLTSPSWSSNGPPPVVVGSSYFVTNAASGGGRYYRLAKP